MPEAVAPSRDPTTTWALAIATCAGLGLLRPAPGTWGSIGAALVVLVLALCCPGGVVALVLLGLAGLATWGGFWAWDYAAARFGRDDPGQMVIDEAAGLWLGAALLPPAVWEWHPWLATLGLLLAFRLIDVIKPWPIGAIDRWPRALGVMADDLVGGCVAGLAIVPVVA